MYVRFGGMRNTKTWSKSRPVVFDQYVQEEQHNVHTKDLYKLEYAWISSRINQGQYTFLHTHMTK